MQKITIAMKKLEMKEQQQMKLNDHDSYNDDHAINKNELVFYEVNEIECDICMEEYQDDGHTCDQCKKNICIKCFSNVLKCPFCRKQYEDDECVKCSVCNNKCKYDCAECEKCKKFICINCLKNNKHCLSDSCKINYNVERSPSTRLLARTKFIGEPITFGYNQSYRNFINDETRINVMKEIKRIDRTLHQRWLEMFKNEHEEERKQIELKHKNELLQQAKKREDKREKNYDSSSNVTCKYCKCVFKNKSGCTNHMRRYCPRRPDQ